MRVGHQCIGFRRHHNRATLEEMADIEHDPRP